MAKSTNPFRYFDSSPEGIRLVVMMYVRYPLSLRNVEDLLFERGVDICHETVRLWWNRFGPMFAAEIRKRRVQHMRAYTHWKWHLDEVYVKINGEMRYLWRAVDHEGEVLESYVTTTRDKAAALKFIKKALKRHGRPRVIITDGLRSYGAALREIGAADLQEVGRWKNNRAENSHLPFRRRERAMSRFRRMKTLQKFSSVHASVHMLRGQADPTMRATIDKIGLGLLIVWVAALQIMLDEGRNHDWFQSEEIRILGVIAAIGFVAFVIWELTEKNPIVDLRIFRHRGFTAAATTYAIGFGAFFASIVILPLWLQTNMGYTATWAGYATGIMGILAVFSAPLVGKAVEKFDPRLIICAGIVGLAMIMVWRIGFNADVTFVQMALPTLITGVFMVMFFVPVTGLAMASVDPSEQANAAGMSNFMRTLAGAFATSLVQTGWSNAARQNQTELVGAMHNDHAVMDAMVSGGAPNAAATAGLTAMVEHQSVMLATLNMFGVIALCFFFAAALIWLAPKPKGPIDTSGAH